MISYQTWTISTYWIRSNSPSSCSWSGRCTPTYCRACWPMKPGCCRRTCRYTAGSRPGTRCPGTGGCSPRGRTRSMRRAWSRRWWSSPCRGSRWRWFWPGRRWLWWLFCRRRSLSGGSLLGRWCRNMRCRSEDLDMLFLEQISCIKMAYQKEKFVWLVVFTSLKRYFSNIYRDFEAGDNQSFKFKWRDRESNPRPLAPQAKSLTTRPPPFLEIC